MPKERKGSKSETSKELSEIHRIGMMLEEVRDKVQQVAEGHSVLERKVDEFHRELSDRIGHLDQKVTLGFKDVTQRFNQVDQRFNQVEQALRETNDRLGQTNDQLQQLNGRFEDHLKAHTITS